MTTTRRHVFGPVPSRRLGRSLGVDLIPHKTCTFDCVYCQLGRTTCKTLRREPYVPVPAVLDELALALASGPPADYVTLAGSGEPTLHSRLGDIVDAIKKMTQTPVAVLTNGSLLWDPDVRRACAQADVVMPTLAAHDEAGFQRIHRPCPGLSLEQHVAGLIAFRNESATPMWLELFLLEGFNAANDDLQAFRELIERIGPERVQLNTTVRPSAESEARAVSAEKLEDWARRLGPSAEVVADIVAATRGCSSATAADVLALCRRRPCTLGQIAAGLTIHRNEAAKYVARLRATDALRSQWKDGEEFFSAAAPDDDPRADRR